MKCPGLTPPVSLSHSSSVLVSLWSVLASHLQCHSLFRCPCLLLKRPYLTPHVSVSHPSSVFVSFWSVLASHIQCRCLSSSVLLSVLKYLCFTHQFPCLTLQVSRLTLQLQLSHSLGEVSLFKCRCLTLPVSLSHSWNVLQCLFLTFPVSLSRPIFKCPCLAPPMSLPHSYNVLSHFSSVTTSLLKCLVSFLQYHCLALKCLVSLLQCDYPTLKMSCLTPPMSLSHS